MDDEAVAVAHSTISLHVVQKRRGEIWNMITRIFDIFVTILRVYPLLFQHIRLLFSYVVLADIQRDEVQKRFFSTCRGHVSTL